MFIRASMVCLTEMSLLHRIRGDGGYDAIALVDEDSYSEVKFQQAGLGSARPGRSETIGRLSIEPIV